MAALRRITFLVIPFLACDDPILFHGVQIFKNPIVNVLRGGVSIKFV
jgi:hypothetical protein